MRSVYVDNNRMCIHNKLVWEPTANSHDTKMLWAASCLCFFAFLRTGELTVPTVGAFDPAIHLGVGDIAMDDKEQPTLVRINIKQSKTDPFRKGVHLYVGRTQAVLCPVCPGGCPWSTVRLGERSPVDTGSVCRLSP